MSVAGSGTTGSSVGNLITGNSFTVNITGPGSGPNVESGKLVLFLASTTSFSATITISGSTYAVNTLSAFPTGNSGTGAMNTTLSDLGLGGPVTNFAYVVTNINIMTSSSTGPLTFSNVTTGPLFIYAAMLNGNTILELSSNSKSGVSGGAPPTVPEPGTLGLLGTGLIGMAGLVRRRLKL